MRLMDGGSGPRYEYGRLEIFVRGFWSTVCDKKGFTPDAALVACRALGYDGGAVLQFTHAYGTGRGSLENEARWPALTCGQPFIRTFVANFEMLCRSEAGGHSQTPAQPHG